MAISLRKQNAAKLMHQGITYERTPEYWEFRWYNNPTEPVSL